MNSPNETSAKTKLPLADRQIMTEAAWTGGLAITAVNGFTEPHPLWVFSVTASAMACLSAVFLARVWRARNR